MVDGNGDDERKTKYFILSIFICVFAGSFQEIFEIQIVQIRTSLVKKRDKPNFSRHRIVQSTEIIDSSNYVVHWIARLPESVDAPNLKNRKKYGYNISSVNGVAEFVKERLYPFNGTEQVLLNGIALECYNIEGQGSTDWSVRNKGRLYFPDSQDFSTFDSFQTLKFFPV